MSDTTRFQVVKNLELLSHEELLKYTSELQSYTINVNKDLVDTKAELSRANTNLKHKNILDRKIGACRALLNLKLTHEMTSSTLSSIEQKLHEK